MRRLVWFLAAVVLLAVISTSVNAGVLTAAGNASNQEEALPEGNVQPDQPQPVQQPEQRTDKEYILSLVKAIEVDAVINNSCRFYSDQYMRKYTKTLTKGEKLKFLRDKDQKSAYIRLKNGQTGWVPYKYLTISKTDYSNAEPITDGQKNLYVNYKGYDSSTKYLIWVNVERQEVNVFIGSKGKWTLNRTIPCSSGKNDTPTINGEYQYYKVYKKRSLKEYYVYNFMRYYDSFAIHSIPFNYNNTINDAELGEPRSHGCIRVSVEDSNWLVKYIPLKTKVVIY